MSPEPVPARRRLLDAAARLVSAAGGRDVSLRAICDLAGVRPPTLYHHFGSKQGLIDAVVAHGFRLYLDRKRAMEWSGDPLIDIGRGWDEHVRFGLENPAFYSLMYGRIQAGSRPAEALVAQGMLLDLARRAAAQGRLRVSPELACEQILAANMGVTLTLITADEPNHELSPALRDAVLGGISAQGSAAPGDEVREDAVPVRAMALRAAIELAGGSHRRLADPERELLLHWLRRLEPDGRAPLRAATQATEGGGSDD